MFRSTSFYACLHAYVQIYIFMCSLSCLCLDLCFFRPCILPMFGSTCLVAMPIAIVTLLSLISLFLEFWSILVGCKSRSRGLSLHPHTQTYIKGFGSFPYMHVYACLLLYFMSMFSSFVLGFAMLSTLRELDLVWLHPNPVWLFLGVTPCEMHLHDANLLYAYAFSTSFDDMLALLACAPVGFHCFYAFSHACLHVHA